MKTFILCISFFALRAFKPEFFDDTLNTVLFVVAIIFFAIIDVVDMALKQGPSIKKRRDADKSDAEA